MIHRSIVSTMERMVAHLLDVHGGALPAWLAPTQVRILPVVDDVIGAAAEVRDVLVRAGLRVSLDDRDASLAARVRAAQQARIPYVAVVGRREAADGTVAVRVRDGSRWPDAPPMEPVGDVVGPTLVPVRTVDAARGSSRRADALVGRS